MTEENKNQVDNPIDNNLEENQENLQKTLGNTELFLEKNKALINKVLIGVIVVLGGYVIMKKMIWEPAEVESQQELWESQYVFERDSFANAIELFSDIKESYSGTDAGNVANLYLGISLMKESQFEEAIDALEDYDGKGYFLPAIATGLLGDCYSETDQADKAISAYKKAANEAKSKVYSPYFLKKAGILLEQNGESENAVKLYQKILDVYYYEDIREFSNERKEIVTYLERAKTVANQ